MMDVHEFSWKTAPVAMDMFRKFSDKNLTVQLCILDDGFSIQQSPQSQIFSPKTGCWGKLPVAALPINLFHFEVQQCPGQQGVSQLSSVLIIKTYSPST